MASGQSSNEPQRQASSYSFTLHMLTYPLAVTYFAWYFSSENNDSTAKLIPPSIILAIITALPLIMAGINIFLVADMDSIDSLVDGWSVKRQQSCCRADIFDSSEIRDLDVGVVNHFLLERRNGATLYS